MARGIFTRGRWSQIMKMWAEDGDDEQTSLIVDESVRLGEAPTSVSKPTGGSGGSRDPKLSIVKRIGIALGVSSGSREYQAPEFPFADITNAYNTEGYVRQAVDKYIEQMFKAGWDFVGKNPNAVEYVRMRFRLMAEASEIPTKQLFIEMAEDIVKYSNVVLIKKRADDPSIFAGMNVVGIGDAQPVAAYFPQNMNTMKILRDQYGTVKSWQQEDESGSGGGNAKKYKAEDVVHIYYKREKGRAFGTPFLHPALEDIKALRQMEESVLRLTYRNLHPLWHMKVGSVADGQGADQTEVDAAAASIENMDVEGGIVTNERVELKAIASNQIIDAKDYLAYFEARVFTVLGVSALMMGRGNTANRSTGDNLSGEFTDRVKAYQRVLEAFIDDKMLNEILMEGGFDSVINPDDAVSFQFKEIDFDSLIKKENQAVFLYEHNAISEDEMRTLLGRDPIEDGDARGKMHLQLVTIATLEAEAALAPAPAAGTSSSGTGGSASKAQAKKKAATDNKTKPANQSGVKSSPKKSTNTDSNVALALLVSEMAGEYSMLREAVTHLMKKHHEFEDGGSHLRVIGGAIAYTESRFVELLGRHVSESSAAIVRVPIKRMMMDIRDKISQTLNLEGEKAEEHALDIIDSVFDIFTDRLRAVAQKAYDAELESEEVG